MATELNGATFGGWRKWATTRAWWGRHPKRDHDDCRCGHYRKRHHKGGECDGLGCHCEDFTIHRAAPVWLVPKAA